jgi:amino acid adenylation domain-containing protein
MPQNNPAVSAHRIAPDNAFVPFPKDEVEQSVPARFESIVRRYPKRLAIKTREQHCTYEELNRAANQVAHAILAVRGPDAEPIVCLVESSVPAITIMLGILKAGKSPVSLDLSFPPARLKAIMHDVQPGLLVTMTQQSALAETLTEQGCQLLNLEALTASRSTDNPGLALGPDTFADLVYTSGSTGHPKGVIQNHRNTLHHCMRVTNYLHLSADDRITLLSSLSTGQARSTVYRALLNGATLYPRPLKQEGLAGLADWLIEEGITVYQSSATVFRSLIDSLTGKEAFPQLRLIRVGGEAMATQDVERYKAHFAPPCLLLNALSTTETFTTLMYLMHQETPLPNGMVPVGYAMDDMEILLLDDHGVDVGVNRPGEIVVQSRYLSPGYWRRPDLTAAAFLPSPQGGDVRIYRTGDLGCRLPDGRLVHMGRKDFQVRIRGYGVELAEVERVLRGHMMLQDVAVMAQPNHAGEQHLVAYIVPARAPCPSITALQDVVRQQLPDHMVPTAFVQLDALPLTASGKVDRQRLPVPGRTRPALPSPYVAPRTPMEVALVRIWTDLLGIEPVGIHDAFLELGGDSLLAMRLVARVRATFQAEMPLRTLLEAPTIAAMAVAITQCLADRVDETDMARLLTEMEEPSEEQTQQQRTDDTVSST